MNLDRLHTKLIAAARADSPSSDVPYGFIQRTQARLKDAPRPDVWALWSRALWRAAAPCVAVVLLLGAWAWLTPTGSGSSGDLSQDLENTVLAAANQDQPSDSTQ